MLFSVVLGGLRVLAVLVAFLRAFTIQAQTAENSDRQFC